MKKSLVWVLTAAIAASALTACAQDGGKYLLSFRETEGGSVLCFGNGFESAEGAFGVRVAYDTIDGVSEMFLAHYTSVTETETGYFAEAVVTTDGGSRVKASDTITAREGKVSVSRTIKVEVAGAGEIGFAVYFPLVSNDVKRAEEFEWFSPSGYYGNDSYTFTGAGVKSGFSGETSVIAADYAGAPLLTAFDGKSALTLLDTTAGFRETIGEDFGVKENKVLIDERMNMPGIGITNLEKPDGVHTQIFHAYPSHSYNYIALNPFNTQYRMLPVQEGLTRTIGFELACRDEESFSAACKTAWREAYSRYAVTDKRYAATDVKDALLRAVDRSYGVLGGVPQYMTNADHFKAESGFLYRNVDLAMLMLSEGRRTLNEGYTAHALAVIDSQVSRGALDENLIETDPLHAARASSDALTNLLRAYENELEYGIEHHDWLNYIMRRAEVCMQDESWLDAAFLTELARVTGGKLFTDKSVLLMERVEQDHRAFRFTGSITNPAAEQIIDRESGIIALGIYLNLYELTGNGKWLPLAEHAALFVESWHQIQPILLEPYDCTGTEQDWIDSIPANQGYLGNGKIMPYGLSYVSAQTPVADISGVLAAPDFYRLYLVTNDGHYLDFYEYITYNSTLYVNMGDKIGLMDDVIHSSGEGFINEYIGIGSGGDKAALRRGSMHDSNIGWTPYAILQNYERVYRLTENLETKDGKIVVGDDMNRDFDLAKHKYVFETDAGYVYDLNEYCDVSSVTGTKVQFSKDGVNWFDGGEGRVRARFVRTAEKNAQIFGLPATYDLLSANAKVSSLNGGTPYLAVDAHNYATSYAAATGDEILLEFTEAKDVYQIAVRFSQTGKCGFVVETSRDGILFDEYAMFEGEASVYSLGRFADGVKFVKLRFLSGFPMQLQDFKVLGER